MKIFPTCTGALAAAVLGGSAFAADLPSVKTPPAFVPSQWLFTVGIGPEAVNQFPGSKTYTVVPNGSVSRWKAGEPEPFVSPDDGFTVAVVDLGWFKAGPAARYISRRGLSDGNGNFNGLRNVGWSLELGGFAEVWLQDLIRAHVEVTQAVNGNHGLEANFAVDAVKRYGPWTFSIGPRTAIGDNRYMNAYFSVTAAESAANGRVSPYLAGAGVDTVGGLVSARYDFNRSWNTTIYGGYNRLVGSAGYSPIPNILGSKDEFKGGATIAYTFAWGGLGVLGF